MLAPSSRVVADKNCCHCRRRRRYAYGKADSAVLHQRHSRALSVRVGSLIGNVLPKKNPLIRVYKHYLRATARLTGEDLETFARNSDALAIVSRLNLHSGNSAPGNDCDRNRLAG